MYIYLGSSEEERLDGILSQKMVASMRCTPM